MPKSDGQAEGAIWSEIRVIWCTLLGFNALNLYRFYSIMRVWFGRSTVPTGSPTGSALLRSQNRMRLLLWLSSWLSMAPS